MQKKVCGPFSQKDVLVPFTVHKMTFSSQLCMYMSPVLIFPKGQEGGKRQIQRMSNGRGKKAHTGFHYTNRKFLCMYVYACVCVCVWAHASTLFYLSLPLLFLSYSFFLFCFLQLNSTYMLRVHYIMLYYTIRMLKSMKKISTLQWIIN